MKQTIGLFILVLVFSCSAFAQYNDKTSGFTEGSSSLSITTGIGNVWQSTLWGNSSPTITASTNFALTYEYAVEDDLGIGMSVGYFNYEGNSTDNSDPTFIVADYQKLSAFSIGIRSNYHFGSSKKIDPYIGGGIEYYNFKYEGLETTTSNNMGSTSISVYPLSGDDAVPFALQYSLYLGAKYYITPLVGINAEAGIDKSAWAQVGITYKFIGSDYY